MSFIKLTIAVLLLVLSQSHAQVNRTGECPEVSVVENFNLTEYMGAWYEIQRYETDFQENLDCVTAEYLIPDLNVSRITFVNSGLLFNETNSTSFVAHGVAVPSFPEDSRIPAKLSVAYGGAEPDRSNYWVLGTDYHNYSLVWFCEQLTNNTFSEYAWVLSRTKQMIPDAYAKIYSLFATNGIATEDFRYTEQGYRCSDDLAPY